MSVDPSQWNFDGSITPYDSTTPTNDNTSNLNAPTPFQDPTNPSYNPGNTNLGVQGGGSTLGGGYTDANGNTTAGNLTGSALQKFLSGMLSSGSTVGNSAGGNTSSLLGHLASLFGGGGASSALLASLLGLGASGIGGALNSSAATGAAGTFAGQTAFHPYSVTTQNGTSGFNGTNATSTLSPGQQVTANSLSGLTQTAAGELGQGTGATQAADFAALQNSQRDSNNKFYQSNLDNQMANGVLSSTAGQYQSQAALDAINKQTTNNQLTAQTMAGTQQQQQLDQLKAALTGSNQINQAQLDALKLGGNLGTSASGVNLQAYSPSLAAGSNSPIGNLLGSMGNGITNSGQANNNALAAYLAGPH